jgi:3-hydroxyisobutyrate dehydrogenase-like beta-hydroxyacid dehydrogenase
LIGLGNMGTAVAERLLDAGTDLVVYNRSRERAEPLAARGAAVTDTVETLAAAADVVLTSVSDDDALEAVATSVVEGARPGRHSSTLSTVSPGASARVAALAERASLLYVRAPSAAIRASCAPGT